MKAKLSNKQKGIILFAVGLLFCILPPVLVTLEYFPLFKAQPDKGVSVMAVLFLVIAVIPLWKYVKKALQSPSAWMVWLCIYVFSLAFSPIIQQMKVISLVSLATSLVGALFFKFARKYLPKKKPPTEAEN